MRILGIETSCDETGVAIYDEKQGLIANQLYSQIALHADYGGVVPELASRDHIRKTAPLIQAALKEAGLTAAEIDGIAYTAGPGLVGALLVGATIARSLAYAWNVPAIGVHHMEAHLLAPMLEKQAEKRPHFPFIALLVSGGHTQLVRVDAVGQYQLLGESIDDAAGEAFDKVARAIGLGYPGGPKIQKISEEGNKEAIAFPRAKVVDNPFDFSFSGVKSAVLNYLNSCEMKDEEVDRADVAASFQEAVVDVLVSHTIEGAKRLGFSKIAMAGGVASNTALRTKMKEECEKRGFSLYYPSPVLCTDNAAMIGAAAYYDYKKGLISDLTLNAVPSLKLGQR